jgi:NADH:ubiquinone oxidoreductase subunit F (NADH-binding)
MIPPAISGPGGGVPAANPFAPAADPRRVTKDTTDVASFYHLRNCSLAGKTCNGTACFVAGHRSPGLAEAAHNQEPRIYCLGQCFAAPAVAGLAARPHVEVASGQGVVLSRLAQGGARSLAAYQRLGGYRALEKALLRPPDEIIATLEASGLRGRGGAGFPVGRKWRAAANQPAGPRFIVANADEGDPGAYIDRFLLEDDPHALLEGMLLAAHAVGATQGWIYLRSEYPAAKTTLENALIEARGAGLLGPDALRKDRPFDIEIHLGGGSYVCGEETALVRSLEGHRPEVMARPPYATKRGLFGRPTVINNVETLANIPWIVERGADAYRKLGFSASRGTKVVSLNSLFQRPGLYEVEFGTSVRHIVEELGGGLRDGEPLKGVVIGGPLAGIVPPHLLETPFGFEELHAIGASVGHGGIVAFDRHTSIAALLHHVFRFAADESCGKCTPCRIGSRHLEQVLGKILGEGATNYWEEKECEEIVFALRHTSLCGLGTGLAEFTESALRHYGKELEPCFR